MSKRTSIDAPPPRSSPPPMYLDLDVLRNSEDMMSVISYRCSNGLITFTVFRTFMRDGREERTNFISEAQRADYLSLVELTFERIDAIKADPDLLRSLQEAAGYVPPPRRDHAQPNATRRRQ